MNVNSPSADGAKPTPGSATSGAQVHKSLSIRSASPRIRDPLHGLVPFHTEIRGQTDWKLEESLWQIVCTPEFQRLRHIKQLGFSDLTYPGATHTRFTHSIGVFHTAKALLKVIESEAEASAQDDGRAKETLAAALLHDVGHGPFSHAFEDALSGNQGKNDFGVPNHEKISASIISEGPIANFLDNCLGTGAAARVAKMIHNEDSKVSDGRPDIYDSVVSSQFDADRLDYVRRDRYMTGVEHSGIAFDWLIANLEVDEIPRASRGKGQGEVGKKPGFVIGPKAVNAAEGYIFGLFQLYPTVYFHKATRGAEKIFGELIRRVFEVVNESSLPFYSPSGLPKNHPIFELAKSPTDRAAFLKVDDSVLWGALPLMMDSSDPLIQNFSARLRHRELYKCIDIREEICKIVDADNCSVDPRRNDRHKSIHTIHDCVTKVRKELEGSGLSNQGKDNVPNVLIDVGRREPYKEITRNSGELEQIYARLARDGEPKDLGECSLVVGGLETFEFARVYYDPSVSNLQNDISKLVRDVANTV